ncbi:MAG: Cna B-type domain-containing protein [Clostridia bacterium]|nr:Cna B-type domain-containing protein [Clostridia bacterium]
MLHRNKKVNILVGVVVVLMLIIGFIVFNSAKADGDTGTLKINAILGNGDGTGYDTHNYLDEIVLKIINTDTDEEFQTITITKDEWQNVSGNNYYYELHDIPNGNYRVEYVSYSSFGYVNDNKLYMDFEQDTFSINDNNAEINAEARLVQKHKLYIYYKDWSGNNSEADTQWWSNHTIPLKFDYAKDSEGNNVYTFNKDGEYEKVKVVDGERTIVQEMPYGYSASSYTAGGNLPYGGTYAKINALMSAGSDMEDLHYFVTYKDSWPYPDSGDVMLYFEYVEKFIAFNIDKTTTDGNVADADFVVRDYYNDDKIALYDHYDTYEFEGTTYSNVYVLNGQTADEGGVISTVDGKATILYPATIINDERPYGFYYKDSKFSIYELSGKEKALASADSLISIVSGTKYSPCTRGINSYGGFVDNAYDYYSIIFGDGVTNSYVQDTKMIINRPVQNHMKPGVTKIVKDSNGNIDNSCTDTFTFGLYDSEFNLISTVEVTGNETKYFDVQMDDNTKSNYYNPTNSATYYVAEIKREDYTLNSVSAGEITDGELYTIPEAKTTELGTYDKAYKFVSNDTEEFNITFENKVITTEVSVNKVWVDNDNSLGARPRSVTVNLLADGEIIDSKDISADNNGEWKCTFSGLRKYNGSDEIAYTISEDHVDSYSTVIDGYNITNTIVLREITVKKMWDDNNNANSKRPESCTVQLYSNNEKYGETIELNEENNWEYTWSDLITERDGNEIIYTIKEINTAEGYTATVVEDGTNGFVITNKYSEQKEEAKEDAKEEIKEEVKEAKVEESKSIKTADFVEFYVTMFILSLFVVCLTIKSNKNIRK